MKKKDNTELITQKAAKAPKSGKTLKGQLFSAVAMMLVATIALGSSTYAWFINNRTVEVQNIDLTVSTSASLLAAVGKKESTATIGAAYSDTNFTPYKATIIGTDITGATTADGAAWTNFFSNPITPASVTSSELGATAAYPKFYKSLDKLTSGKVSNFDVLTHDTEGAPAAPGLGVGPVKHLRLSFKSSSDQSVYFGRASTLVDSIDDLVTEKAGAGNVGTVTPAKQAEAIRSVLRVAIVPLATATITAADEVKPKVFQFDTGTPAIITGGGNNTYYPIAAADITHDAGNLLDDVTGLPTGSVVGSTLGVYASVLSVVATEGPTKGQVESVGPLTAQLPSVSANNIVTIEDTIVTTGKKDLFKLKAGEPRIVDVYMWLDGTDEDCLNELSSYNFSLALPFVAAGAPA